MSKHIDEKIKRALHDLDFNIVAMNQAKIPTDENRLI